MKALKVTLLIAVFFAALTSCTKQDLDEDDVLNDPTEKTAFFTGGDVND
ncbi:hypothetical protein [Hyunsoonleella aestuarii]|nr:hypothetical protein [Hyunsoonleella aestuarii]